MSVNYFASPQPTRCSAPEFQMSKRPPVQQNDGVFSACLGEQRKQFSVDSVVLRSAVSLRAAGFPFSGIRRDLLVLYIIQIMLFSPLENYKLDPKKE